jgi:rubrerythrin
MIKITTLNDLFEFAKGLEHYAQEVYAECARMFSGHSEAARIFGALAEDEKMHELELEKTRSGLAEEQLGQPGEPELVHKAKYLQDCSVEKTLLSIHNLNDAIEVAQDLENSEVNQLFRLLAIKSLPNEIRQQFVEKVISQHLSRLREFTGTSFDAPTRRNTLPNK